MTDIHHYHEKLNYYREKISNSDLPEEDLDKVNEFVDHKLAEGVSEGRVVRYLQSLQSLLPHINFSLSNPSQKNIKSLIAKINRNSIKDKELSVWTLCEYRKFVKNFYKYVKPGLDIDFITTHPKKAQQPRINPDELPGPEDVNRLLKNTNNSRNRCLIALCWDTGGRIGEILNLKWKDIQIGHDITKLTFTKSKTGQRTIPILESSPYIKDWKEDHPEPNQENFVFTSLDYPKQVDYDAVRIAVKRCAKRACIDCKYNFHAFRKGRATYLANQGFNSPQLCQFFGWDSFETARRYVRLADSDLENRVRSLYKLPEKEKNMVTIS